MNFTSRLSSHTWLFALAGACGFLLWIDAAHIRRIEYISGLAEPAIAVDATTPTGYAGGLRRLIVPEHNNDSYQWIAQTQQMLAQKEWRVRHVSYDNAPLGREVRTPSPYRWWLGLVAWCDHFISGRSLGLGVERAALWADPALHLLLLASAVIFTARKFGNVSATLLALGLAAAFPFAGEFSPGQPNDTSLALAGAFWSVLLLLAGLVTSAVPRRDDRVRVRQLTQRWFFAAGVAGGIGLWTNVGIELPVLGGIAVGGIIASWRTGRTMVDGGAAAEAAPWRIWALGGAVTCLGTYCLEYFPAHMGTLRLETNHPLYGLAWLGAAELLERTAGWLQKKNSPWNIRQVAIVILATLAVAALPVAIGMTGGSRLISDTTFTSRLSALPDSATAQNLWTWLSKDGFTAMGAATFLPLLLLFPAIGLLMRQATSVARRELIAVALGPVVVALIFACFRLGWWNLLDGLLLTLLVAVTAAIDTSAKPQPAGWRWTGSFGLILVPGFLLLLAPARTETRNVVESEVLALIERDLAYWLANQAGPGGAIVLAPPGLTTSLYFHGGLTGLGTPYWENKDGFTAAVRIAGATSLDEAQAATENRSLNYIVIPSWDPFMDEYARLGSGHPEHSLLALLHQWQAPRWLQPVPYHVPKIAGFEGLSVAIFQVVDVQDNPTALGRLAEYFIEMGQIDQATLVSQALARLFPADLGALVARTLVAKARDDAADFAATIKELPDYISRGEDSTLPWNRRVSLAIALAEGKRFDLAKEQIKQCLAELDEARVRSLTSVSLYRLQVLSKAFGFEIEDPRLRALSRELLPAELRANL